MSNNLYMTPENVLPHGEPIILLTSIARYGKDWLEAEVDHAKQTLFCNQYGQTPAWVTLEYMAQAISAYAGVKRRKNQQPPRIGLLLGCRKFVANKAFYEKDEVILVRVSAVIEEESQISLFDCRASTQDHVLIAEAQIKGIQPDSISDLFHEQ